MAVASRLFSATTRRTAGLKSAGSVATFPVVEGTGALAGSRLAAGGVEGSVPAASMIATFSPTVTVSPSCLSRRRMPADLAGISTFALSVSSSQIGSSRPTRSPSFLCHFTRTAWVTDSPSAGTCTVVAMDGVLFFGLHSSPPVAVSHWFPTARRATKAVHANGVENPCCSAWYACT